MNEGFGTRKILAEDRNIEYPIVLARRARFGTRKILAEDRNSLTPVASTFTANALERGKSSLRIETPSASLARAWRTALERGKSSLRIETSLTPRSAMRSASFGTRKILAEDRNRSATGMTGFSRPFFGTRKILAEDRNSIQRNERPNFAGFGTRKILAEDRNALIGDDEDGGDDFGTRKILAEDRNLMSPPASPPRHAALERGKSSLRIETELASSIPML